jgi:hypothetical protein
MIPALANIILHHSFYFFGSYSGDYEGYQLLRRKVM